METDQSNPPITSQEPENIEELQKQKLLLEIKQLARPWYKQYLLSPAFLPTLLAIGTLILALTNGLFDIKKEKLQLDIAKFENEKNRIINQSTLLKNERDSLLNVNLGLRLQKDSLAKFVSKAIKKLDDVNHLVAKIPVNYILLADDGKPMLTEDGKFIRTEDDPIVKQLRIETRSLRKIFDGSFDKTF